ncbi:recombinase family protein [Pseudomonas sp. R5(2019)]|uniref:recombinase family protein n=1 Tax=Pseudomonas sp. R5(2019) TaxID=2697566 RepID=UPI001412933A|nr:recombinase family protein [Pseudomonas sp. R5(2019)]NBA94999.1 recombinase family protein [Pseudomonas sp. R5(2019)]
MFIRAYLRASTTEQDANRARDALVAFAADRNHKIASFYVENESGASLQRPELFRLLSDAQPGDVLLLEQVDRLSRLKEEDWNQLRATIKAKGVLVVALDLPTSHQCLAAAGAVDEFTSRMLSAVNDMLLDMLAAVARKDYEDRRRRQAEGIEKAKIEGAYKGRPVDTKLHGRIKQLLDDGKSVRKVAELLECSTTTVQKVKAALTPPCEPL